MQQVMETDKPKRGSKTVLEALGRDNAKLDLTKRVRLGEEVIRWALFVAGVFSVFTTLFIVVYLGSEAANFLNTRAWVFGKALVVNESIVPLSLRDDPQEGALTSSTTTLLLDVPSGERVLYTPNSLVQIDKEIMRVVERRERSIIVQRGQNGTEAVPHAPASAVLPLAETATRTSGVVGMEDTLIPMPSVYSQEFQVGQTIRIDTEVMRITAITDEGLVVERGQEGTIVREHEPNAAIEYTKMPSLIEFFTTTTWQPETGLFGVLPLINATLMTTFFALIFALPVGLAAAIYLSEYASARTRATLGPILELLVGVPTVVYGYFALQFVTQGVLQPLFGREMVNIYNTLSAGMVVGLMIVPTIASMSIDAMSAVPRALREASYGLGATKLETVTKVVLPAALSGIIAAVVLGISRAIGETMIVALAAGAGPNFTYNPFAPAETMTGHIARISGGDLSYQSVQYSSIFAIGLTLFVITFGLTQISTYITQRFREVYE
jgi:phosphate transport system permease protein